jgi:oxygen-independent coproporphyrinogen III oxidase
VHSIVPPSALGVYVHFPWCRRRCPYCDFAVEVAVEPPHRLYLETVLAELADQAPAFAGRDLVSVYFGGGTPSLWAPGCVAQVIAAVRSRWLASGALEITMEANPTDCEPERLAAWRAAGVTRISVGVQSTRAAELRILGRDHRMGDGMAAVERIAAAGGLSISADFIVGVPRSMRFPDEGQARLGSDLSWISLLAATAANHVSVYELTIEQGAAFAKRVRDGRLLPRESDALADLYLAVHDELGARGFEHYEISSYARAGHRAVHNSLYWSGGEYLGLGVGASSYRRTHAGAQRWSNRRRFALYQVERVAEVRQISDDEDRIDRLWLGMRTSDGVPAAMLESRRGVLPWLLEQGLATLADARVRPTLRGFLFADTIADRITLADR